PRHGGPLLGLRQGLAALRHLRRTKDEKFLKSSCAAEARRRPFSHCLQADISRRACAMKTKSVDLIFWDAAQLSSAAEREAYLDRACAGDAELRQRIEQLLQARSKVESFLEVPAPHPVATVEELSGEHPGTVLGPYKLLEQIGEGGFGIVFMAEQHQPVRRK